MEWPLRPPVLMAVAVTSGLMVYVAMLFISSALGQFAPFPWLVHPRPDVEQAIETKAKQHMRILILGGGAIGVSIAYYLAARGADVIVIERSAIACAASGKSGGFLAMDWCDGTPLMHLARRSFALHAELAEGVSANGVTGG